MPPRRLILILLCITVLFGAGTTSVRAAQKRVAVVISQRIKPYVEAFAGFREESATRAEAEIKSYYLDKYTGSGRDRLAKIIGRDSFDLVVAIGPAATRFVWTHFPDPDTKKLYTMVLRPANLTSGAPDTCGIALDIPPETQLKALSCFLPSSHRVGILYNPDHNSSFLKDFVSKALAFDIEIVPMAVSSTKGINALLQENWRKIDTLLFIPDPTVIYESLVKHLIKQALLRRIPSVGFNRFFHENGASLTFVLDYKQTGKKTGRQALSILEGTDCAGPHLPEFTVHLNTKVTKYIGITTQPRQCPEFKVAP
ncbi:MAG: ABC transporter substrate binding protein [Thermodesulfobacteriota bacterium]|nr:ABC transporter substrate binding protein [Thermodesulfobacteriota bacterium]